MEVFSVQTLSSVSAINSSKAPNQPITFPRRTANFHPSVWGDHFLKYASSDDDDPNHKGTCSSTAEEELEHARLKEEVRKMLVGIPEKSLQKLEFIDKIQRLGLSYHFETEIEASLSNIYDDCDFEDENDDLYAVALRFRLLRQTGRYVSCDGTFNKFMNSEGKLEESKVSELKGMLSLYEASNFRVHRENYLEEAFTFTTSKLQSMVTNKLSHFHVIQVKQALNLPIQKALTRLSGVQYIPIYQEDESHNHALQDLAKLDFNRLQKLHQMELCEITKWWKELDCATNFPFARDRIVECYFWVFSVYFEPQYALGRSFLNKVIALTSIIDDMYEAHGTLDELNSFTTAIQRWDMEAINQLPMYMSHLYRTLLDVFANMEEELGKSGKSYRINYSKEEMKKLVRVYNQEAYWCHNSHLPTFDECMEVTLVSCGYFMLATTAMVGMGDSATKECFDWVSNYPVIVRAASVICRLTDDIVGYEREKERGDVAFCVESYMKEFEVSKEEAMHELWKHVKDAWKDINRELLNEKNSVPMPVLERILNLARVIDLLYKDEDWYTNSRTKSKQLITILLVDPVV